MKTETQQIGDISIENNNQLALCANCGKEGSNLNICNKCKAAYCNAACKKKHRSKHKKECEKRVAELYEEELERKKHAAELHDEALFKEHPPEECPICFLPLPRYATHSGMTLRSCCGKRICNGCIVTMIDREGNIDLCPFCRTSRADTDEDVVKRVKKLMYNGNADAFNQLATKYDRGINGLPQDHAKANELWLKAGELGCANAYYNLANSYIIGRGVVIDKKKATHYWELAAMNGSVGARHNLGTHEYEGGKYHRAMKHFNLAAKAGDDDALNTVKGGYIDGYVTKEEYANTLREYQKIRDEMKSEARDKALEYIKRVEMR